MAPRCRACWAQSCVNNLQFDEDVKCKLQNFLHEKVEKRERVLPKVKSVLVGGDKVSSTGVRCKQEFVVPRVPDSKVISNKVHSNRRESASPVESVREATMTASGTTNSTAMVCKKDLKDFKAKPFMRRPPSARRREKKEELERVSRRIHFTERKDDIHRGADQSGVVLSRKVGLLFR